jgi:oligopeptide/dipeptide ABC transporter ATP-binding protein
MTAAGGPEPVLRVRDLAVEFATSGGVVHAVTDVSYDLLAGQTLAIVGESGCGKTVSALALLGLLPRPQARVTGGRAELRGRDLLAMGERELRHVRGREIAMVFQDPMTSLNPVMTVGAQIAEALAAHEPSQAAPARAARVVALLALAGVPDPARAADAYPPQLSGGMRQRVMVAMAIANHPSVLIADEPTTALDVTVQAQVLDVLRAAQRETGAATLLITHDLGVVAEMADRVAVMYAGRVVELADVATLFRRPRHPYTVALLASLPRLDAAQRRLAPVPGQPPSLLQPPPGCPFHPRCWLAEGRLPCRRDVPPLHPTDAPGQHAACHYWDEVPDRRGEAAP